MTYRRPQNREVTTRFGFGLGLVITMSMLVLAVLPPGPLMRIAGIFLDLQFKLRGERPVGHEVVLVVIDDQSIKEIGRWPWSRDKQAQLVTTIGADGAKVIGMDIIYTEPEFTGLRREFQERRSSADTNQTHSLALRESLDNELVLGDTDQQFVESLQTVKNVVLAVPFLVREKQSIKPETLQQTSASESMNRSAFMLIRQAGSNEVLEPYQAVEVMPPLKPFADKAVGLGHVYSLPDPDGVTRDEYLALRYHGSYYPSFGLEVARVYLGIPRDRVSLVLGEGVQLNTVLIPTDQRSRMLINYAGGERSFQYISATDVLHKRVSPGSFKGKVVLVGTTALGTYDQKATPFSANVPGVEKNATVIDNILNQHFLEKNAWSLPLELTVILLCGLTLTYALQKLGSLPGTVLAVSVFLGYAAIAQYFFVKQGIWIPVFIPLLTIMITFIVLTVLNHMTEEEQAMELRRVFSSYVNPRIAEKLVQFPSKATRCGQRREVTMLFADVVDFTTFSEKHSAEEVVLQLNEYLGAMTDVVFRLDGTLDKFIGDEIVAFWGAPLDQPDHAELATKCALHMRKRLGELQEKWQAEGKVLLDNGIGINTGMVVVGNIGAESRRVDYTIVGDHVKLAARFQRLTRKLDCPIVVTEFTAKRIKGRIRGQEQADNRSQLSHISLRWMGSVKIKGKDEAVGVYAVGPLKRGELSCLEEAAPEERNQMGIVSATPQVVGSDIKRSPRPILLL